MNALKLRFHDLSQPPPPNTLEKLAQLAEVSFAFTSEQMPFCTSWLAASLKRAHLLVISEGYELFMFASMPERPLLGRRFLWGDGGCVLPALQNQRIMEFTITQTLDYLGREQVGWFGGRTQSTYALRGLARLGFLRPVEGSYADDEGRAITDFLAREIAQLQGLKNFDPATGVCRYAFPGSIVSAEASIAHHMTDVSPSNGDAVVCVCRLDTPASRSPAPGT